MNKFPKKYNYKNTSSTTEKIRKGKQIQSTLFPADKKLHPGCIFSLYFQDLFAEISNLKGNILNQDVSFGLSSGFYSKLNKSDINLRHLESEVLSQLKQNKKFFDKLGLGPNIDADSFVYSEQFNRYVRKVFVDLYKNDVVSLQKEMIHRSKNFQTNLFENNIETKEEEEIEYTLKYFIDSKGNAINILTTSLETIFADVAVAVNPQDKRYKKLIGQSVIVPIINKIIPIIGDEDIDSFKGSGVCRVTPGHNQYGLELAQKHGLATNVFAVDINGNFTKEAGEFSGKPVGEFLENIIKYIDDIGNLESKKKVLVPNKFDIRTGEKLDNLTLDQRSVNYSYSLDYLSEKLVGEEISIIPEIKREDLLKILDKKQTVNISNKSTKGVLVPIVLGSKGDVFPIDDATILDRYKSSGSKRTLTLTLIVANLMLDNHLSDSFTIEQLIDALFNIDLQGEKTKLEKYLDIYRLESENHREYKRGLKDIEKLIGKLNKDSEQIQTILDLLKDSFAIKLDGENIYLDFASLFAKRDDLKLQNEDSFNKSFLDSVWFLYKNNLSQDIGSYGSVKNMGGTLFTCSDEQDFMLNTALLTLEYSKKILFSEFMFHPILVDNKNNKITNSNSRFLTKDFGENLSIYGPDVMRLVLLLAKKEGGKVMFDTYQAQDYHSLLNKIRNASRYVNSKYMDPKKEIKIKTLIKKVKSDITDYDLWMIHGIKTILDDFDYQVGENKILELGTKILSFCRDTLCDKYLESTKLYADDNTPEAIILSFAIILRLIKPYIPFFVGDIESRFNINREDYNIFDFREFELKEKNYKINLLMDIVDKLQKLKLNIGSKKHEYIDIFIQANPEFIDFLLESEELLKSLVKISNIECIRLHENMPIGYETDNVININLGVKAVVEQVEIKKDVLVELKEQRDEKIDHMQHIKSLIASVSQAGNEDIIKQKRKEVSNLQQEIDDLEFEISKLKAK